MGKRQRRRLREQGDQPQQQDMTPAVVVQAGLATAECSVTPGPDDDEEQGP